MGGRGSGWQRERKTTVEEGLTLNVKDLVAIGALVPAWRQGSLSWRSGTEIIATVGFGSTIYADGTAALWLSHVVYGERMHYTVTLVSTAPHYGGRRWWFICPIEKVRVSKLYLPPGATQFASRKAHNLTYRSVQESGRLLAHGLPAGARQRRRRHPDLSLAPRSLRSRKRLHL
jgi:hypothetical protein